MSRLFAWETELPTPDLEQCKLLELGPGRLAVEMAAREEKRFGFYLPDKERKNRRPSLGIILAMGKLPARIAPRAGLPKTEWPILYPDVKPGDVVFVRHDDGKRIEGFGIGTYDAKNEVRLLGIMALYKGLERTVPWDESIFGVWDPMTKTARAVGRNVILKLPEKPEATASGIFMPDDVKSRIDVGQVLSAGGQVADWEPGDIVVFERRALHHIHSEEGQVYAFIKDDGIYGRAGDMAELPAA